MSPSLFLLLICTDHLNFIMKHKLHLMLMLLFFPTHLPQAPWPTPKLSILYDKFFKIYSTFSCQICPPVTGNVFHFEFC